jgi:hypothetical protein
MKEYIEKIREVELSLSEKFGDFNLFVLLEREDVKNKWDILFSITLSKDKSEKNKIIKFLHNLLRENLPKKILLKFSRIVYLEPNNGFVQNLNMMINVQHGSAELKDVNINNMIIKHAHIISSKR